MTLNPELHQSTERWRVLSDDQERHVDVAWLRARRIARDDWPGFVNLFVDAPLDVALDAFAASRGAHWETASGAPDESIFASTQNGLSLIAAPMLDPDDPPLDPSDADALFEALGADGLYITHDVDAGALTFARYARGHIRFLWADMFHPPHSTALHFHEDGRCTEEDGRRWALRALGMTSSDSLDRYAFVTYLARNAGARELVISPDARSAQRALHMA